jgi:hypothetical protein
LLLLAQFANAWQGFLARLGPHQGEHFRQAPARDVLQRCPARRRQAGDFQRVARDHFQVQTHLGPGPTQRRHDLGQVEKTGPERHLGEQKPSAYSSTYQILKNIKKY